MTTACTSPSAMHASAGNGARETQERAYVVRLATRLPHTAAHFSTKKQTSREPSANSADSVLSALALRPLDRSDSAKNLAPNRERYAVLHPLTTATQGTYASFASSVIPPHQATFEVNP